MKKILITMTALCAGMAMADLTSPTANWTKQYTEPVWWFDSAENWKCYDTYDTVRRMTGDGFPAYHDQVFIGDWRSGGLTVYLKDGDVVTNLYGLSVCHGHSCTTRVTLEIRKGAYVSETFNSGKNEAYTHTLIAGDAGKTYGKLLVDGGTLVSSRIDVGGGTRTQADPGQGWLEIANGGVVTNNGLMVVGANGATSCVDVVGATYIQNRSYATEIGSDSTTYNRRAGMTVSSQGKAFFGSVNVKGTGYLCIEGGSDASCREADWSAMKPKFNMNGAASHTNKVVVKDSALKIYNTDWNSSSAQWARWSKFAFRSLGYSEFIQDNSVVTNCGVWFWPTENAGNVYPIKPPKYIIKGGELYIYNQNNYGDQLKGYGNGVAAHGFAAATNAPNSGTISLVDAPKVSYPRVCTNLLLSGAGQDSDWEHGPRVFGRTDYRPHFEFVLTKKGQRAMEIREQTDILGMYSFVPQGGLQVVQTNRFALIRHKTASKTLSTLDEPQFRAPNADLWTTGGFADTPREWGVTLKPTVEIALGADLGEGVASGYVTLPRCNPKNLVKGYLRLKLAPAAKTVAEVVADMNAAGYSTTLEGTDVAVVDLKASGMLAKGTANKVLLDFNAPQDAVAVRDNVKTVNARILKATTDFAGLGLVLLFR